VTEFEWVFPENFWNKRLNIADSAEKKARIDVLHDIFNTELSQERAYLKRLYVQQFRTMLRAELRARGYSRTEIEALVQVDN
jgi:hypothetical protein